MSEETEAAYISRKKRWMEREQRKEETLAHWKKTAILSLLELSDEAGSDMDSHCIYDLIVKILEVDSWEAAFMYYDETILNQLLLEGVNDFYNCENKFRKYEEVLKGNSPETVFVRFIEHEMDKRPGIVSGGMVLDILDKLGLLKYAAEL